MSKEFKKFWKGNISKEGHVATPEERKKDPYLSADSIVYPKEKSKGTIVKELKEIMSRFPDISDEELCRLVANRVDESIANVKQVLDTGEFN